MTLADELFANGGVLTAQRDSVAVGFAVVLPPRNGVAELDGLFVDPPFWRQRIGTFLVGAAIAQARLAGAGWMHVVANAEAAAFYASCGFHQAGEATTQFGTAVSMRRPIR